MRISMGTLPAVCMTTLAGGKGERAESTELMASSLMDMI